MGVVWIFFLSFISALSPSLSLWETARYRLKYCLKGSLNPKQPSNQRGPEIIPHRELRLCLTEYTYLFRGTEYCILLNISTYSIHPRPGSRNWPSGVPNGVRRCNNVTCCLRSVQKITARRYFSLCLAISQREGEREDKKAKVPHSLIAVGAVGIRSPQPNPLLSLNDKIENKNIPHLLQTQRIYSGSILFAYDPEWLDWVKNIHMYLVYASIKV